MTQIHRLKWLPACLIAVGAFTSLGAQAALFPDDEARTAILELRQRQDAQKQAHDAAERRLQEENNQLRRSLLDLQNQIEGLRTELARTRGQDEQFTRELGQSGRELTEVQRRLNAQMQAIDERLRVLEPQKVSVEGREFVATAIEKKDFDAGLAIFRTGDFAGAQVAFVDFAKRHPQSGYYPSVLFWLGNAQYATRDYKEAIANFRAMLTQMPEHPRAAEAMLSIANCQIELKDTRAARRSLEDVVKAHPKSEAAQAAKDRLLKLR